MGCGGYGSLTAPGDCPLCHGSGSDGVWNPTPPNIQPVSSASTRHTKASHTQSKKEKRKQAPLTRDEKEKNFARFMAIVTGVGLFIYVYHAKLDFPVFGNLAFAGVPAVIVYMVLRSNRSLNRALGFVLKSALVISLLILLYSLFIAPNG